MPEGPRASESSSLDVLGGGVVGETRVVEKLADGAVAAIDFHEDRVEVIGRALQILLRADMFAVVSLRFLDGRIDG